MTLRVLEIFDSLQGEGRWTGIPMTFVRLAGCNAPELGLTCTKWCDTPDSWSVEGGREMGVGEVIAQIRLPRVCITGGEPLLQRDGVERLALEVRSRGVKVHVETNGTIAPPIPTAPPIATAFRAPVAPGGGARGDRVFDWATVSPKPPGHVVASGWSGSVDELKFILDDDFEAAIAERVAADHPEAVVCIQPVWGESAAQKAVAMVADHPDWRLSLQTHKFLGMR